MKTIIDAVNEFKGEFPIDLESGVMVHEESLVLLCHTSHEKWLKGFMYAGITGFSADYFDSTCNKSQFNDLVSQMETNFGECSDVAISHWKKCTKVLLDKELDKELEVMDKVSCYVCHVGAYPMQQYCGSCGHELLSELIPKQPKPVFTQAMADNGELPSVGMECFGTSSRGLVMTSWKKGFIIFFSPTYTIFKSSNGIEFCCNHRLGQDFKYKPLTPPKTDKEKAIDDMYKSLNKDDSRQGGCDDLFDDIKAGKIHGVSFQPLTVEK